MAIPTVWLCSHSRRASDDLLLAYSGRLDDLARIERSAFERDARSSPSAPGDSMLAAAVLVLEPLGLKDPKMRSAIDWCCRQVQQRDDFRLYLCVNGISAGELAKFAEADSLLRLLRDTVHMADQGNPELILPRLKEFLRGYEFSRASQRWRNLRLKGAWLLSRAALTLEVLCVAAILPLAVLVWVGQSRQIQEYLSGPARNIVGFVATITWFPMASPLLLAVSRGMRFQTIAMRFDPHYLRICYLGLFGTPLVVILRSKVGLPMSWGFLGVAVGVLLEVLRRTGWKARRLEMSLDESLAAETAQSAATGVAEARKRGLRYVLRCAVLPETRARVFISYSRESTWGRELAERLSGALKASGVECFLDREDIAEGSNWRRSLMRKVGEANVFITLADCHSVNRVWTAAELTAAIFGKPMTGSPKLIAIRRPDHPGSAVVEHKPVFKTVLEEEDPDPTVSRTRVITAGDETVRILAAELARHRFPGSPALVPKRFCGFVMMAAFPLVLTCELVSRFGPLLIPWFVLQFVWGGESMEGRISEVISAVVFLVLAASLGFIVRMILTLRFEMVGTYSLGLVWWRGASALGSILGMCALSRHVSPLIIGWGIVLVIVGWMAVSLVDPFLDEIRPLPLDITE